jgi:hypothetical protein
MFLTEVFDFIDSKLVELRDLFPFVYVANMLALSSCLVICFPLTCSQMNAFLLGFHHVGVVLEMSDFPLRSSQSDTASDPLPVGIS